MFCLLPVGLHGVAMLHGVHQTSHHQVMTQRPANVMRCHLGVQAPADQFRVAGHHLKKSLLC